MSSSGVPARPNPPQKRVMPSRTSSSALRASGYTLSSIRVCASDRCGPPKNSVPQSSSTLRQPVPRQGEDARIRRRGQRSCDVDARYPRRRHRRPAGHHARGGMCRRALSLAALPLRRSRAGLGGASGRRSSDPGRASSDVPEPRLDTIAVVLVGAALLLRAGIRAECGHPSGQRFREHVVLRPGLREITFRGQSAPGPSSNFDRHSFPAPLAFSDGGGSVWLPGRELRGLLALPRGSPSPGRAHLGAPAGALGLVVSTAVARVDLCCELRLHDVPGTLFLIGALFCLIS